MIIKGRELILALSINKSFNVAFAQREPGIYQALPTLCVCCHLAILFWGAGLTNCKTFVQHE